MHHFVTKMCAHFCHKNGALWDVGMSYGGICATSLWTVHRVTYEVYCVSSKFDSLQWRHNELECVSNHQPHHCLLNRLFGRRSKKTSKLRVTGLCAGNSPGTGEFPAQMASNAEMFPFDDVIMLCSTMGIAPCWIIELGRVIPKAH